MNNKEYEELERQIVESADACFYRAGQNHLNAGRSIVVSQENSLYRIYPNGKKEFIKNIIPSIKYFSGKVIKLK